MKKRGSSKEANIKAVSRRTKLTDGTQPARRRRRPTIKRIWSNPPEYFEGMRLFLFKHFTAFGERCSSRQTWTERERAIEQCDCGVIYNLHIQLKHWAGGFFEPRRNEIHDKTQRKTHKIKVSCRRRERRRRTRGRGYSWCAGSSSSEGRGQWRAAQGGGSPDGGWRTHTHTHTYTSLHCCFCQLVSTLCSSVIRKCFKAKVVLGGWVGGLDTPGPPPPPGLKTMKSWLHSSGRDPFVRICVTTKDKKKTQNRKKKEEEIK